MTQTARASLAGVQLYTPESAMVTMKRMARDVRNSLTDAYVVRRANEIVAAVRPRDYPAQIGAIQSFMEMAFYFVDNPIGVQRIQPPAFLLHDIDDRGFTQGACDDAAVLIAALGEAIGIPAKFVAYAFGTRTGDPAVDNRAPFTHVIAHLLDGAQWVMLDVTRPEEITRLPDVVRSLTLELD